MVTKRIISTILAVVMLLGALVITVGAEDVAETPTYTYNTSNAKPTMNYLKGETLVEEGSTDLPTAVDTPEKKLATMDLRFEKDGYRLYVDAFSGEVATQCVATGEVLFSNPYNINSKSTTTGVAPSDDKKRELLSQIILKYTDLATGTATTFYSFDQAVQDSSGTNRGQIDIKNIKNGIRVEYTIGRENARMLYPRQIEKTAFETKIRDVVASNLELGTKDFYYTRLTAYYTLRDPSKLDSQTAIDKMHSEYPITKKMAIYTFDSEAAMFEKSQIEQIIKDYAPNYTYEELDADHLYAEAPLEDENPPLFKMALEYTLDEFGVSVRLPANGIRFNETLYQLEYIEILPYMGAGKDPNSGYTFFPDGSGALFDFEEIAAIGGPVTLKGLVYGEDYAYHTIDEKNQQTIRYPVFGVAETEVFTEKVAGSEEVLTTEKDRGFIAVVEEGDALMELELSHAVTSTPYNTVKMRVYPRPKDTYNIADAISVGANSTWTVTSSRKYTGNYKIRYMLLADPDVAAEKGVEDFYECNYVGMAKAYRNYLEEQEILTKLTADDVKESIPLYLETFGSIATTKKILSIPVDTMAPLTSFEDIQKMYTELSEDGVDNINFILTGYTKGGMTNAKIPYNLKWDSAVGGKSGFEELLAFAKEEDVGIYPDFDFAFVTNNGMFDGLSLKKHAVKTIDNRYTSKRVYSATKQAFISYFELAISPAYFSRFYTKLTENYLEYEPTGIAVSTLGAYLNSDFDEDEPYNRDDAKSFTVEAFDYLDKNYDNVLTSGGNVYTWKYVDHITDAALDSSRYAQAAAAVPFLGIVLHGYVQFAGEPINMEGNIDYALLKAIENGASLNFILSYNNTDLLKESETLNEYYSVRYDIWYDDLVSLYNELNAIMKDLQTVAIDDHVFIEGERVPDEDELLADARADVEAAIKLEKELEKTEIEEEKALILEARLNLFTTVNDAKKYSESVEADYDYTLKDMNVTEQVTAVNDAKAAYEAAKADPEASEDDIAKAEKAYNTAVKKLQERVDNIYKLANDVAGYINDSKNTFDKAKAYLEVLETKTNYDDSFYVPYRNAIADAEPIIAEIIAKADDAKAVADKAYNDAKDIEGLNIKPYEVTLKEDVVEKEEEKVTASKYASDKNMIVLMKYENGTSFVLNFNNYDVTVVVDGIRYTVETYGYVVIKK